MAWSSFSAKDDTMNVIDLYDGTLVVYDFETNGLSEVNNRVIQFAGIKYRIKNRRLEQVETFDRYIRQPEPLPKNIAELTGITDDILNASRFEAEIWPEIRDWLSDADAICGHNIKRFDMKFLRALYDRYGDPMPPFVELDTLEMARELLPSLKHHKMCNLIEHYDLNDGLSFHNAIDDVKATVLVLAKFVLEYEKQDPVHTPKKKVTVSRLSRWDKGNGFTRVYVDTKEALGFYYDRRNRVWEVNQRNNPYQTSEFDMKDLYLQVLAMAKAADEDELIKKVK